MNKIFILLALSCFFLVSNKTLKAQDTIQKSTKSNLPIASIGGVTGGMIAMDTLKNAGSLICSEKNYTVISFTMFRNMIEYSSSDNMLTSEMKKSIKEIKSGDKLYFENIKVKSPEGNLVVLSPIILKVK